MVTTVVRTVPGTVAVYQPVVLKAAAATSAPDWGTLAASCSCQPEATTTGSGAAGFASAASGANTIIEANARKKRDPQRIGKLTISLVLNRSLTRCVKQYLANHTGSYI